MSKRWRVAPGVLLGCLVLLPTASAQVASGWLRWRGPDQNGTSAATGLPDAIVLGGDAELWSYPLAGRGTPVIADGRVYTMGYLGEGPDLQERLVCLDEHDGSKLWEHRFNDFLTDTVYDRYSIGSPGIDPQTGNVYCLSTAGELTGFTRDGRLLWQRSMFSEFGRITFPNGRTGSPAIDEDRVIIHVITANWGPKDGPAADRFYAFDKQTGELVWSCTPGTTPQDSCFSMPVIVEQDGRRLLYSGTGCGHVVCIDARTGDALWRFPMSTGGVNSAVLLHGDGLIAVHGMENLDRSTLGRMVKIKIGARPAQPGGDLVELDTAAEVWRAEVEAFTSSPVLVGDRVYQTVATGELLCIDANDGKLYWQHKLAPDQIHASPLYADGKLYVPMTNGSFHILRPTDAGPQELQSVQLEGQCLGAPAVWDGRLYVHTTARLYCFGTRAAAAPAPKIARLQIVPSEVVLHQGETRPLRVRGLDDNGAMSVLGMTDVSFAVKGGVDLTFTDALEVATPADGRTGTAIVTASARGATGTLRVRVVGRLPYREDFESIKLDQQEPDGVGAYAFPPGHWIGARLKFDVRELDGNKVLAKTLNNQLFQRAQLTFGEPDMSDYSMQVDIRTDGNRRILSSAGVIHQRYLIQLKGNYQELEVSSNMERVKQSVPFAMKPDVWYRLKTRVDVAADGSGIIRAKAWPRDDAEPAAWTIEVPHRHAHRHGSPGLFGFAPQSRFRVYLDNLQVIPND